MANGIYTQFPKYGNIITVKQWTATQTVSNFIDTCTQSTATTQLQQLPQWCCDIDRNRNSNGTHARYVAFTRAIRHTARSFVSPSGLQRGQSKGHHETVHPSVHGNDHRSVRRIVPRRVRDIIRRTIRRTADIASTDYGQSARVDSILYSLLCYNRPMALDLFLDGQMWSVVYCYKY